VLCGTCGELLHTTFGTVLVRVVGAAVLLVVVVSVITLSLDKHAPTLAASNEQVASSSQQPTAQSSSEFTANPTPSPAQPAPSFSPAAAPAVSDIQAGDANPGATSPLVGTWETWVAVPAGSNSGTIGQYTYEPDGTWVATVIQVDGGVRGLTQSVRGRWWSNMDVLHTVNYRGEKGAVYFNVVNDTLKLTTNGSDDALDFRRVR
jgi:hypothetical protein